MIRGLGAKLLRGLSRWGLFVVFWVLGYVLLNQMLFNVQFSGPIGQPTLTRFMLSAETDSTPTEITTQVTTPTHSTTKKSTPDLLRATPRVAAFKKMSGNEIVAELMQSVSSIPLIYRTYTQGFKRKGCFKHPTFYDLKFNNDLWQHFQSQQDNTHFYVFGAYYDDRKWAGNNTYIRILVMADKLAPPNITCQLWMNTETMLASNTSSVVYIWRKAWGYNFNGTLHPFLVSCPLPSSAKGRVPQSVSLVDKPCDNATTNIRVFNFRPRKKGRFAVCVKGMDFLEDDISVRLVEWFELLKILGAEKMFVYELAVHPNVSRVIHYYEKEGWLENSRLTLPGDLPNFRKFFSQYFRQKKPEKRQNEVIPYNDCFYKHMYSYDYLLMLDTDEVIVPIHNRTWDEMMKHVLSLARKFRKEERGGYYAPNVYFFDDLYHEHDWVQDIPHYMHMLQHIFRAKNHTKPGTFVKSFYNTNRVLTVHNHMPIDCLGGSCFNYAINESVAQLQHYRKDCDGSIAKSCKEVYKKFTIKDTNLWKYKSELINATTRVLQKLEFLPS